MFNYEVKWEGDSLVFFKTSGENPLFCEMLTVPQPDVLDVLLKLSAALSAGGVTGAKRSVSLSVG